MRDEVIELVEVTPAQAQELAEGHCPLPATPDYPHADTAAAARMMRGCFEIDNWVPGYGLHLIRRVDDQLVVGDVGFHFPPDERGVVEISYGLAPSARGQGLASRAVRLLVGAALARPACSSVVAETTLDNPASIRVLQACGFTEVARTGDQVRYQLNR